MRFHGFEVIPTSEAVYCALFREHREQLKVFITYTNIAEGVIETVWRLKGADYPLMAARTTWDSQGFDDIDSERKHQHWLCVSLREAEGEEK